jgi:hypothetical protein
VTIAGLFVDEFLNIGPAILEYGGYGFSVPANNQSAFAVYWLT